MLAHVLIIGRIGVSLGLLLFLAWLVRDARGRTFRRAWLARSILALLGAFAIMSTFRLAVMRWPALAPLDGALFLGLGALSLTIGVGVWVPTVRAWLARRSAP